MRFPIFFAFLLALGVVGCEQGTVEESSEDVTGSSVAAIQDTRILPIDKTRSASHLQCQVYCSSTVRGISQARFIWQPPKSYSDPTQSKTGESGSTLFQRIDVTVYKQGFEKEIYAVANILRREAEKNINVIEQSNFQIQGDADAKERGTDFQNIRQTLDLSVVEINQFTKKSDAFEIQVAGLVGGVNYFWRVLTPTDEGWVPSQVTRCQARVCPVDNAEEESNGK